MPKSESRRHRWEDICTAARRHFERAEELRDEMRAELQQTCDMLLLLDDLRQEYEEWRDNLPEGLQNSPTGELLDEIVDLDLMPDVEEFEEVGEALDAAESVTHPIGFGRD